MVEITQGPTYGVAALLVILLILVLIVGCAKDIPGDGEPGRGISGITGKAVQEVSSSVPEKKADVKPPEPQTPRNTVKKKDGSPTDLFSSISGPHWGKMPIRYFISDNGYPGCGKFETRRIIKAFDEIQNVTEGLVSFKKVDAPEEPYEIFINCSYIFDCYTLDGPYGEGDDMVYYESVCDHALGFGNITNNTESNISLGARVELMGLAEMAEFGKRDEGSGFMVGNCGHTNTEIHEILHTMGYEHVLHQKSIMYPASTERTVYRSYRTGECEGSKIPIDPPIISHLKCTYDPKNTKDCKYTPMVDKQAGMEKPETYPLQQIKYAASTLASASLSSLFSFTPSREFFADSLKQQCLRVSDGKCKINLPCIGNVNYELGKVRDDSAEFHVAEKEKIKLPKDTFEQSGDSQDTALLVAAEFEGLLKECQKENLGRKDALILSFQESKGNDFPLSFGDSAELIRDAEEVTFSGGENNLYPVCFRLELNDPRYCVLALAHGSINGSDSIYPLLNNATLFDPYWGGPYGVINEDEGVFALKGGEKPDSRFGIKDTFIELVITPDEVYWYNKDFAAEKQFEWIAYKDFLKILERQ
ncbi:hypothetical protein HYU14_07075 [Candidatus Woesearchaeota archaeon]|nr:hypothetical protein [Candidatus Woesearchaeota archaeon]